MILTGINFYLYWGVLQDLKERKIQDIYLKTGIFCGMVFNIERIFTGTFSLKERVLALLPGILFWILSKVTKESVGIGDGMLLFVLGNFMDIGIILNVLQGAFILLIIFALVLLGSKKAFKSCQIPFLPFLWMSQTILWGIGHV